MPSVGTGESCWDQKRRVSAMNKIGLPRFSSHHRKEDRICFGRTSSGATFSASLACSTRRSSGSKSDALSG